MPTYEYECTRCDHVFEEFKPMSAPKRQRCPKCRGKVNLIISGGIGLHFKGSGFYVTDSKKTSATKPDSGTQAPSGASKPESVPTKPAESKTTKTNPAS